ncbi:MAG: HD domain-containing phosphohydrolase [Candidatus Omnitrophota bacterium]
MAIDYKKELETAAKNMILVHEPDLLIKMIVRTIVQKIKVRHAGILLRDKEKNSYVLNVSGGPKGIRVPAGFARMDPDNPLIRFFTTKRLSSVMKNGAFFYSDGEKMIKNSRIPAELREIIRQSLYQMDIFDSVAGVPSYFQDSLLGVLLLGKKANGRNLRHREIDFLVALASDVAMAIRNAQLFKDLEQELIKKHNMFINTTVALAAAVDAKDHYTHGHINRVTNICMEIVAKLTQKNKVKFSDKFMENLHIASLLHDIGKIGIPEAILNKPGPLTDEERKIINGHTLIGVNILQPIKELETVIQGVKYHHERYDGAGYPEGLKGDAIPILAAIIAVADSYDAMTLDRPYRNGLSKNAAMEEIETQSGKQFHPMIVQAFSELYREGKI